MSNPLYDIRDRWEDPNYDPRDDEQKAADAAELEEDGDTETVAA